MMPYVNSWSEKHHISPSKLLMPLSFAAILGGCVTLIGTSTNLIVNGLVVDQDIVPGMKSLNIFDFAYVGLPMVLIGVAYLYWLSPKLLPDKQGPLHDFGFSERTFLIETQVKNNSSLEIGRASCRERV